jgi:hypothetical protein
MYLAFAETKTVSKPGDQVFSQTREDAQSIGTVVAAGPKPEGRIALLAVLEINAVQGGKLCLYSPSGPRLCFNSSLYRLEET